MSPSVKIKTFLIIVLSVFFLWGMALDIDFSISQQELETSPDEQGSFTYYVITAFALSVFTLFLFFKPIGDFLQQIENKKQDKIHNTEIAKQRQQLRDEEFEDWYRREVVKMQVEITKTITVMKMSHANDMEKLHVINQMEREFQNSQKDDLTMLSAQLERLKNIQ